MLSPNRETTMMTRRNGSGLKLVLTAAICGLFVYGLYTYHDLHTKLRDRDEKYERIQQQHDSLSAQLQVVYEHKSRLEKSLQQEKSYHKKTKDEMAAEKANVESKFQSEKQELLGRINTINQEYKMMQTQHEDLQADLTRAQDRYSKLEEDHQQQSEQHNMEYQQLRQEKENEITLLKDELANHKRRLNDALNKIDLIQQSRDANQRQLEVDQQQMIQLSNQVASLQNRHDDDQQYVNQLNRQIFDLQAQVQQYQQAEQQQQQQQQLPQQQHLPQQQFQQQQQQPQLQVGQDQYQQQQPLPQQHQPQQQLNFQNAGGFNRIDNFQPADDNVAAMNQGNWNNQQTQPKDDILQGAQQGQWSNQGQGQVDAQGQQKVIQQNNNQAGWGLNFPDQNQNQKQGRPESDLAGGRQEAYMDNKMAAHNVEGGWNALPQKGDWEAKKSPETGNQAIENPMQIRMPDEDQHPGYHEVKQAIDDGHHPRELGVPAAVNFDDNAADEEQMLGGRRQMQPPNFNAKDEDFQEDRDKLEVEANKAAEDLEDDLGQRQLAPPAHARLDIGDDHMNAQVEQPKMNNQVAINQPDRLSDNFQKGPIGEDRDNFNMDDNMAQNQMARPDLEMHAPLLNPDHENQVAVPKGHPDLLHRGQGDDDLDDYDDKAPANGGGDDGLNDYHEEDEEENEDDKLLR